MKRLVSFFVLFAVLTGCGGGGSSSSGGGESVLDLRGDWSGYMQIPSVWRRDLLMSLSQTGSDLSGEIDITSFSGGKPSCIPTGKFKVSGTVNGIKVTLNVAASGGTIVMNGTLSDNIFNTNIPRTMLGTFAQNNCTGEFRLGHSGILN